MTSAGLSESMTFAFIERVAALPFCSPGVEPAAIANPLSEKFAVLRPSLLPGLVDSCAHNRRRGRKDVRLFETGSRFTAGVKGARWRSRGAANARCRTGRLRRSARGLLRRQRGRGTALPGARRWLAGVFGVRCAVSRCAAGRPRCEAAARAVGVIGQLMPAIAEARGFPHGEEIYVAEMDVEALGSGAAADELRAETLPKFPSIVSDISILVDEALPAAAVRGTIRSAAPRRSNRSPSSIATRARAYRMAA